MENLMEAGRENSTKPSVGQFLQTVKPPDPISPPMQSCNLWSIILRLGGASKYVIYTSFYVSIVSINFPVRRPSLKLILRKFNFLVCSALNLGGQLATYCPSKPSQLLVTTITKHCDRVGE